MALTIPELLERLREVDECPEIEAKRAAVELGRSALDTISAFSNEPGMGGGYLLFGLEEDVTNGRHEVVGIADPKKLEQEIATVCANVFNRAVRPKVWVDRVDGRALVAAFVPEASPHEKPVYIKKSGIHHGTFRRVGSTDQRCTEEDLRVLFRAGDTTAYEDTLAPDAKVDELDLGVITSYRRQLLDANPATELRDASPLELVQAVGGARHDAGRLVPTVAGVFLFGSRLLLRRLFPQHRVDYIRVPGTQWVPDSERRYASVEIRDPLLTTFRRAYQAVIDDLPRSFVLDPGSPERRDQTAVPETVVREALVNALTHRDYRIASAIQVIRYADRIEIRNPGHSLVGAEQFGQPGSYPRNPRIADVFREMRLAENKGTGIEAMRRAMKRADLVPPVFDSDARGDRFVAILWFHSLLDDAERSWLDSLNVELTAGQRQALVVAGRTGFINNSGLRDLTGLDPLQARRELHRLRELGLLVMRGERGGAYYVLAGGAGAKWPDWKVPEDLEAVRKLNRGELAPERGELSSDDRGLGLDRGELGLDRGELGSDRGELGPDRGEPSPVENAAGVPDRSMLPAELSTRLAKLGRRPRQGPLRAMILRLCAWRPLRAAELAAILQVRPDKLTERHLAAMLAVGALVRTHPDNPTHPDQAYRAAQPERPADDHDEDNGVDDD
jgi:ATP-dependent DNA helicase RecG